MIIFILLGIIIAIFLSYVYAKRFVSPLIHMTKLVEHVSKGDLTIENITTSTNDELGSLGRAINHMTESLHTIVSKVQDTSREVNHATNSVEIHISEMSTAAQEADESVRRVAAGAENQVEGLRHSSTSAEEIIDSIQHIVDISSQVTNDSNEMAEQAERGNEHIQKAISEIFKLNESTHYAANKIQELKQSSDSIGNIAVMISDLSSQTNLLSLNASIEAARAGEHGRGFAVVAEEVKRLAEQSESSAKEIAVLIGNVQKTTGEAVADMNNGLKQLDEGKNVIHEAGIAFEQILAAARSIAINNKEVHDSSKEISTGSSQISLSIYKVTEIAKDTSDNVKSIVKSSESQVHSLELINKASESMLKSVGELKETISLFNL